MQCLHCKKITRIDTDLELCQGCMSKYDVDRLWNDHDLHLIDALDFNENQSMRNNYLIVRG